MGTGLRSSEGRVSCPPYDGDTYTWDTTLTIEDDLTVSGSLTVTTDLTVAGDLTIEGDLTFGDASTDTLTVTGVSNFAQTSTWTITDAVGGDNAILINNTFTKVGVIAHKAIESNLTYTPATAGTACPIAVQGKVTLDGDLTAANNYPGLGWGVQGQIAITTGSTIDGSTYGSPGAVYAGLRGVVTDGSGTSTYTKGQLCGLYAEIQMNQQNANDESDFNIYGIYVRNQGVATSPDLAAGIYMDCNTVSGGSVFLIGIDINDATTGIDIGTSTTGIKIGSCTTAINVADDAPIVLGTTTATAATKITAEFDETTTGVGYIQFGSTSAPMVYNKDPGATPQPIVDINVTHSAGAGDAVWCRGVYSSFTVSGDGDSGSKLNPIYGAINIDEAAISSAYTMYAYLTHDGTDTISGAAACLNADLYISGGNFTASQTLQAAIFSLRSDQARTVTCSSENFNVVLIKNTSALVGVNSLLKLVNSGSDNPANIIHVEGAGDDGFLQFDSGSNCTADTGNTGDAATHKIKCNYNGTTFYLAGFADF